jgi:hypothetical protein
MSKDLAAKLLDSVSGFLDFARDDEALMFM